MISLLERIKSEVSNASYLLVNLNAFDYSKVYLTELQLVLSPCIRIAPTNTIVRSTKMTTWARAERITPITQFGDG